MRQIALLTALAALSLAGCGNTDSAASPGGVSAGEAKALDEAAEMLDAQRLPPEATAPAPAATAQPSQSAPAKQ